MNSKAIGLSKKGDGWQQPYLVQSQSSFGESQALSAHPPIGCKVKKESEAFSDEFSACLLTASEPVLRQHSLAPPRFP